MAKDGRDVGDVDLGDQALVEGVIGLDVGHHDAEQIIDLPGHPVELDDLGEIADHLGEALQPLVIVLVGGDGDEGGDAGVDLARIEERDAADDDALLLELLDAAPAGRGRQADPAADLGDRHGRVLLEDLQNLAIETIDHRHS